MTMMMMIMTMMILMMVIIITTDLTSQISVAFGDFSIVISMATVVIETSPKGVITCTVVLSARVIAGIMSVTTCLYSRDVVHKPELQAVCKEIKYIHQ